MSEPRFSGTVKGILEDAEHLRERFKNWYFICGENDRNSECETVEATWMGEAETTVDP